MDINIYVGGHRNTTEHFLVALKENKDTLDAHKIAFLPPDKNTIQQIFLASKAIREGKNADVVKENLLTLLVGRNDVDKLIVVDFRYSGQETRLFEKELFYPKPGGLIKHIQAIFGGCDVRVFIETRDLATYIPACYSEKIMDNILGSFEEFLSAMNSEELRWSTLIDRAQGRNTLLSATVWRYEDYPLIWRDILGAMTRIPKYQDIKGPSGLSDTGLSLQNAVLLYKYTQKYSVQTHDDFGKVKKLFLEQDPHVPKEYISPDWTQERKEALSYSYNDDCYYIERMDDVEMILPQQY